ncbi:MAG: ATP synthase subunit I [Wenzhouxiangellaceae bacterium]|nr:ATP synthase subunit I [Wenzhouxiangellaceae bacterium]
MSTDSGKPQQCQSADRTAGRPAGDSGGFAQMAVWLLRTQAVLVVVAAVAAVILFGPGRGLALIAGGGIGIVLTAVAALRAGAVPADAGPAAMTSAFYRGMMLKLALAVLLFVGVAVMFAEWFLPVLSGYVVTLVAYWVALLRIGTGKDSGSRKTNGN